VDANPPAGRIHSAQPHPQGERGAAIVCDRGPASRSPGPRLLPSLVGR
jgi:hypothetical protein